MIRLLKICSIVALLTLSVTHTVSAAVWDETIDSTVEINALTENGPLLNSVTLGFTLANIGDLNDDGVTDLAAGSAYNDDEGTDRGSINIMFMNADGSVDSTAEINDATVNGPTLSDGDTFGIGIAGLGDLNGDGVEDIAVGASGDDEGGTGRGAVHILFLNTDGSVDSTVEINSSTVPGISLLNGDGLGAFSIANIGDLNDDGVIDIAVPAAGNDQTYTDSGAIHLFFMNTDGSVDSTVQINDATTNGPSLDNWTYMYAVAGLGDLNDDGVEDILMGSPGGYAGAYNYGAAHIAFMNTDGSVDSTIRIDHNTTNAPPLGSPNRHYNDWFGVAVANVGDLDGDGITDIAVGAHISDYAGTDRGAVYVMFLNEDGSVKGFSRIDDASTNGPVLTNADQFGLGLAGIGDLNGDGVLDIAAGANGDDAGGSSRGAIHILFLNPLTVTVSEDAPTFLSTVEINDETANGPVLSDSDWFGYASANIGDLNDDGVNDIVVGAVHDDNGGTSRGAVHILFMNTDGSVDSTVEINDGTSNGPVLSDDDLFGISVAGLGDLNADGVEDIAVGASGDDEGGTGRGAVHILFLNTDGSVDSTVEINSSTTNGPSLSNGDGFSGTSVANIGDLNDDGVIDLAVGASGNDQTYTDSGAIHLFFMNTDGSVDSTVQINDATANGPSLSNYTYLSTVTSLGDLNSDGVEDLLMGSPAGYAGYYAYGAVHIAFMNTNGSIDSTVRIDHNTTNAPQLGSLNRHWADWFGVAVANLGDINSDGITDIAVGAHIYDYTGSNQGAMYVMFLNANGSVQGFSRIDNDTVNGPVLSDGDQFGLSITNIGDLNGDGGIDLAVGAMADDAGGTDRGTLHILFLESSDPGSLGGGSSSYVESVCKVSNKNPTVGDEVTFNVTIDTSEDSYEFVWTKVLEGDDEDTEYTFDTVGTFYPRGQIKSSLGYAVVNCGTITVEEDDDTSDDEDDDSSSSSADGSRGSDDADEDESGADDGDDTATDTSSTTTTLTILVSQHRDILLSLQSAGITLPDAVIKLLAQITSITTTSTAGSSTTFTRDLELGATGDDVTALQNLLITQGFSIPAGATGYFGAQTQTALIQFQIAKGIMPAVGYFGPITRTAVEEL
jgi:hypothetical protein